MTEESTNGSDLTARTTQEVLYDHLRKRRDRQIEEDIATNYAPDVIFFTSSGILRGHEGLRELVLLLEDQLPKPSITYGTILVENEIAFLEWTATSNNTSTAHGSETYLIRRGQIIAHTFHYSVEETPEE